ncbi:hypothetical protein MVEN_02612200 [Mycena venus]|uniref:Uncharacterized protein n=1 Tax=Mycena venus TaxID=2733690 RepID=A0A8H6U114_9AGAR|nr:hypothetical protein MVEN_02612200 [Mycena venus]
MDYVVDPAEFAVPWAIMLDAISLTCTSLVLYGLYIVLFFFAIRALMQRDLPRRRALLITTSVMFFLGTCGAVGPVVMTSVTVRIVNGVVQRSSDLPRLVEILNILQLLDVVRSSMNNVVTDLLFLYRCYIIWGSKRKVLILPALCILATVVLNVLVCLKNPQGAYLIDTKAPFIMTLGTNLLLMFLTAGRIWYKGREVHTILGPAFRKKYNSALALILESDALYCFSLVVWVASLTTLNSTGEFAAVFAGVTGGLVIQIVNIAPTLILVRVGMGQDRIQATTAVSDRLPSGGSIRFRVPVNLEDESYPVVDIK